MSSYRNTHGSGTFCFRSLCFRFLLSVLSKTLVLSNAIKCLRIVFYWNSNTNKHKWLGSSYLQFFFILKFLCCFVCSSIGAKTRRTLLAKHIKSINIKEATKERRKDAQKQALNDISKSQKIKLKMIMEK